ETGPEAERGEYELVCTEEELDELVQTLRRQKRIAVDTETTGLERDAELCGICLAWKPGHGVYVPIRSPEPERCVDLETVTEKLGPILEDPEVEKCGHNIKFDALALRRAGIVLRGAVFDSMLASMLLEPGQAGHKLDELAARLLNYKMISIESLIGDGEEQAPMDAAPLAQVAPFAAEDADVVMRLYEALAPRLEEAGMAKLLDEVEAPLALVLAEMETHGILLDPQELQRQGEALAERVEELRAEILEIAGVEFHLDSPKQ